MGGSLLGRGRDAIEVLQLASVNVPWTEVEATDDRIRQSTTNKHARRYRKQRHGFKNSERNRVGLARLVRLVYACGDQHASKQQSAWCEAG